MNNHSPLAIKDFQNLPLKKLTTMKKITKLFSLVLISLVAFGISSCTDKYEYEQAAVPTSQVYFSKDQAKTITVDKKSNSFDINLYRVDTNGDLTVSLTFTPGNGNIYNVPTSATFADGKNVATITISYNPEDLVYGEYTGGTITVEGEGIDTTYGVSAFAFTAGATEWVPFDVNNSYGTYREDCFTTFWKLDNLKYSVYMEKSIVNPGMYRMKNVYGKAYPYNEEGDYDTSKDYWWVIDATDPDFVYFKTYASEANWGYGQVTISSLVQIFLDNGNSLDAIKQNMPNIFGKLRNGVITMPVKSMAIEMADLNPGNPQYAGVNGMTAVALPGSKISDYAISAEYTGRYTDTHDVDYALFDVTLGADVASAKYALVASGDNPSSVLEGMVNGTLEVPSVTEDGEIAVQYEQSGKYYFILVACDEEGKGQNFTSVEINLRSSKDGADTWSPVALGVFQIGNMDISELFFENAIPVITGEMVEGEAILYQNDSDPTKFYVDPFLFDNTPLYFSMLANGQIITNGVESGYVDNSGESIRVYDTYTFCNDIIGQPDLAQAVLQYKYHSYYLESKDYYVFHNFYATPDGLCYACERDLFAVSERAEAAKLANAIAKARKAAALRKQEKTWNKWAPVPFTATSLRK